MSVHHSGREEIRCQFTILARGEIRGEIRCQFIILGEIQCRFIILEEIRDCSKDTGLSHHAALALCRILVV